MLDRVLSDLGVPTPDPSAPTEPEPTVPLPSRLATGQLARASVGAVHHLAGISAPLDPERIALAYRSDRFLSIDGVQPTVWSPYSGFWRTSDGWIRTHGNYPHHAARLLHALALPSGVERPAVAAAIGRLTAEAAASAITDASGLAVVVRPESPAQDARLRSTPLIEVSQLEVTSPRRNRSSADSGVHGIRVLDLTRVIAGPVTTRTLALLGADVLRVDPPTLPEPDWQHLDTGHGKRSTLLDARTSGRTLDELLGSADVVVLGYRPAALDRLGLSPESLARRHPGLVIAQLSAWGTTAPQRAGFDSLVQAESGIAMIESADGTTPGALPAQALDHSAGYLLAAAVIAMLGRRRRDGGTWWVRTSLRRVAAELLGMPRSLVPGAEHDVDVSAHTMAFDVDGRSVTTVRPALPGLEFRAPHAWGSDQPRW